MAEEVHPTRISSWRKLTISRQASQSRDQELSVLRKALGEAKQVCTTLMFGAVPWHIFPPDAPITRGESTKVGRRKEAGRRTR